MRRAQIQAGVVLSLLVLLAGPFSMITAAQNPIPTVGDRVFPEPMEATAFVQWPDFEAGILELEERHSQYMEVRVIGESINGYPIYFVELTNKESEKSRDEKLTVGYSASIHANEASGREGMTRVIEDLASGEGPLGDLQPMLDDLIVAVWFPNPDSWASGDWFGVSPDWITDLHVPSYERGNAAGLDLNRQFPNPGVKIERHTPLSEPESRAVVGELRYSGNHDNLVTGTDWHGMINSPNMLRSIIPNQDMDFHRMMVAVRYLQDLEERVNTNPHFAEWATLSEALCLLPEQQQMILDDGSGAHQGDDGGAHAESDDLLHANTGETSRTRDPAHDGDPAHDHPSLDALKPEVRAVVEANMSPDGVWTVEDLKAVAAEACEYTAADGGTGGAGHGPPFLWGARWDQIGYTDSGFTSDYLMLSPRSPTGGMGAVGTITETAYSHIVPNNHYVAKLTDMHVAGVRETVQAQMEYTLLMEAPRLTETGPVTYIPDPERSMSAELEDPYESSSNKPFDLDDEETWFDFNQVEYDVANTDFWADLDEYSDDPVTAIAASNITRTRLDDFDHLVLTDQTVELVDAALILEWVEDGGNLILTDAALRWFDEAGLTSDAAQSTTVYLGHSDLQDMDHPLLAGVDWNARQTGEGIPVGYAMNEYPQWTLNNARLSGLSPSVAGTTQEDPSLGSASVGEGSVHFIGAALPRPAQQNDHRFGLAPYAVTALTYTVFVNALSGQVEWQELDEPYVPFYPADPLNEWRDAAGGTNDAVEEDRGAPLPTVLPVLLLVTLLAGAAVLRRRRD